MRWLVLGLVRIGGGLPFAKVGGVVNWMAWWTEKRDKGGWHAAIQ